MRRLVQVIPLIGIPEIAPGDDLAIIIMGAVTQQSLPIDSGSIFVVAQKVVSKSEGEIVRLDSVRPSKRAVRWAAKHKRDARLVELALRDAKRIVRMEKGIIITETRSGFICANAGVDTSNTPKGTAVLLPEDPDRSARRLKAKLDRKLGKSIAVIISDTFGRPWREGLVNVALGVAGIGALLDYRGRRDAGGKLLRATVIAVADELASAAELVMGKSSRIPVAIIQGLPLGQGSGSGRDLIRPARRDLFR
ncbi:MAG TPA: coenzyme F420-0:L-glutamate ligase [Candidatus Acidoferrales bacterium]|nr:coenzyme F420-0:L-glutamate ligase [Candidatus Acidoferrales bacterium]